MRIALFDSWHYLETWRQRFLTSGHDVAWWGGDQEEEGEQTGKGLSDRMPMDKLMAWAEKDPKTLYIFGNTEKGQLADDLRKQGKLVLGSGVFNHKLETDREFGERVATLLGTRIPPSTPVSSVDEAITFLEGQDEDERWYYKPSGNNESDSTFCGSDIPNMIRSLEIMHKEIGNKPGIMQKKIPGVVTNTTVWWNGKMLLPTVLGCIEHKQLLTGDLGPNTGCQNNLIWVYDGTPRIYKEMKFAGLEGILQGLNACPGFYDMNAIISDDDHKAYFLEMGPRIGYDEDLTWLTGLNQDLAEILYNLADGTLQEIPLPVGTIWGGTRLTIQPYPYAHPDKKHNSFGKPLGAIPDLMGEDFAPYGVMQDDDEGLAVGTSLGLIGVVVESGPSLDHVKRGVYKKIKALKIDDVCYRTDLGEVEKDDFRKMKGRNFEIPKGV